MLNHLSVRNVVLINTLDLDFNTGLTVLTGETGAGKSILLDSLGLALGSRADFSLIGTDGDHAEVTAIFTPLPDHPAYAMLDKAGIRRDDEIVMRRKLRDGKSSAMINDTPVSIGLMREIGDSFVEIQGQFEGRGLLDSRTHRGLLDRFAGNMALVQDVAEAWQQWVETKARWQAAVDILEKSKSEEEWLRETVHKLDDLAPQEGEAKHLTEERQLLGNISRLAEAITVIEMAIDGEQGVAKAVALSQRTLERIQHIADTLITPLGDALERLEAETSETAHAISTIRGHLEDNPERLHIIDDRLHELRGQARKHHVEIENLPALYAELKQKLADLDDAGDGTGTLAKAMDAARQDYIEKATRLSEVRHEAASRLDARVMAELPPIKLEDAQFITQIERQDENNRAHHGIDAIHFEASANRGIAAGAIDKIASGGELARFLLALKIILADTAPPMTLIFDEVDTGVGGAAAAAVGARLARLGEAMQTLVVTHSPQVAAQGDHHLLIAKSSMGESTISHTEMLETEARIEEISRMLAGEMITTEARAAAIKLLKS